MKRVLFALSLVGLLGSGSAEAGLALEIHLLSTAPNPLGSLDHNRLGPQAPLVGTNLIAPSVSVPGSDSDSSMITSPITGFLNFTTGAYDGVNDEGDILYRAGGNFFVLDGPLSTSAGTPPLAYDATTGAAVVKSLGDGLFELTMLITNGFLSEPLATSFGVTPGFGYTASLTFEFIVDSRQAGNQLKSGSIQFLGLPLPAGEPVATPEPASALMIALGLMGVASARSLRSPKVRSA